MHTFRELDSSTRPSTPLSVSAVCNKEQLAMPVTSPCCPTDPLQAYVQAIPSELLCMETRVAAPIADDSASTTHGSKSLAAFAALKIRERDGTLRRDEAEYFRYGTPITRRVESKLAALDHGESAVVFRSGMAAIDCVIDALLPVSREVGHIIVGTEGYRQTRNILDRLVARGWVELSVIPMDGFEHVHRHIKPNTAAVFFETPSNPYLRVIDVHNVADQIKAANSRALVVVDHTFASPLNQSPLLQGAHVVVPSLTKYVSGDNRVGAGAVIGSEAFVAKVRELRGQVGNIASDVDCLGVEAGLATLQERTELFNRNGLFVADLLHGHPLVRQVWYPAHPSHPDFAVAKRQMPGGGGGVVSFRLKAQDFADVEAFVDAFIAASPRETFIAPSFGGPYPLISAVPIVSHFRQSAEERRQRGIYDDLLRLSVGNGSIDELKAGLDAGFAAVHARL